jgi:uncharacterized membrane protein
MEMSDMHTWPSLNRLAARVLALVALLGLFPLAIHAQGGEPSPIEIELVVPEQAGPGTLIELQINYRAVDLNAGADLNYNVFGPCHIRTREPEPPNPLVNTWMPNRGLPPAGTIKIQLQVDPGTEGQIIQHQVEIRWGGKARHFDAQTAIKAIPPTSTPTATPRPRLIPTPVQPTLTPTPASASTFALTNVAFTDLEGKPVASADANQEIVLQISYTSSGISEDMPLHIRFEPDVVNLQDAQRTTAGYSTTLSFVPDSENASTISLRGRIRPYEDAGQQYSLRAIAQVQPEAGAIDLVSGEAASVIEVSQTISILVKASVDSTIVRTGGNIIIHALCENLGQVAASDVLLSVSPLPPGFSVSPAEQRIDRIQQGEEKEERLFTIHTPNDWQGSFTFKLMAEMNGELIESEPRTVEIVIPVPLSIEASVERPTVRAGETIYVYANASNGGKLPAQGVTAKLVDTTNNLGVLVQDIGDIAPGEAQKLVFMVEIPPDFPADVVSSLVVQLVSADGSVSTSLPLAVTVACVPRVEASVQSPSKRLESGQSMEVIVTLRNTGQCLARDVLVSIDGLPGLFAPPPQQKIVELAPGTVRYVPFNILIPEGYQGSGSFVIRVLDSTATELWAKPVDFVVGGVPVVLTVVFGFLVIVAVMAVVVGIVFYFRHR